MTIPVKPGSTSLKTKDEVFDCFREFKAVVENWTGKNIKVLHSDNDGEYIDKKIH